MKILNRLLILFFLTFAYIQVSFSQVTQTIVYDILNGDTNTPGESVAPNLSAASYVTATNIDIYPLNGGFGANGGLYSNGWTNSLNPNQYFHFSVTTLNGTTFQNLDSLSMSLTSEDLTYMAPNHGPEMFVIRASTDNFLSYAVLDTISLVNFTFPRSSGSGPGFPVLITDFSALGSLIGISTIEFRIYAYDVGGPATIARLAGFYEGADVIISMDVIPDTNCNVSGSILFTENSQGNFSFTPVVTNGDAPFTYSWDFGDGNYSTLSNPNNTYTMDGTYLTSLIITDSNGCWTAPIIDTIHYSSICNASFTSNNISSNLENFTNTSTGVFNSSYWDFDNGNTSTVTNPIDTFLLNGAYNVCLTVSDTGCTSTFCDSLFITGAGYCHANYNISSINGSTLNITPNSTTINSAIKNFWDFGHGSTSISTLNTPLSHTYASAGTYSVMLIANDTIASCSDTNIQSITVNTPCAFTPNYNYIYGSNGDVSFTSLSTGIFSNEYWDFGDSNPLDSSINPTHNYNLNGTYYVCLTTIDTLQNCSLTFCDSVVVANAVGNPCLSFNASYTFIDNGSGNFSFNNTSTGLPTDYHWNFGDGITDDLDSPSHTYSNNGTYIVSLTIFDSLTNCQDIVYSQLTVSGVVVNTSCNASFVIVPDSNSPANVIVFNTSIGNNLNYFWDFGDGNTSTQQFPNYTFNGAGPFNLCLSVTDSLSGGTCYSNYCDSIDSGGLVFKGSGFSMKVLPPIPTGIENSVEFTPHFNIYPNPFYGELTIELNLLEKTPVSIFVTDILGNIVSEINTRDLSVGENKLSWDANGISNGIYFLNIKSNDRLSVEKIILNK